MGRIPTTVGLARGDGLVARFGNVVIFLAGESPSTERVLGAAETASSAGDPGVAIAQRLAATVFTSGSAHPPAFGVVAPTSGGILILLRGPVRAVVDGPEGTRQLSGVRAMTWADEILRDPVRRLTIAADARTTTEIPHTDLRAGVAAAGGFILHAPPTGITPHSRTTSSALPKPTPPPTDPAASTPTPDQTRRAPLPTPSHTRFASGETPARHTPPTSATSESPPEPPVTRPQTRAPEPPAPQPKTPPSAAPAARHPQTTAEPPPAGPETIAAGPEASAHSKASTAGPAASRRTTSPEPAETQAMPADDQKNFGPSAASPLAHRDPPSSGHPIAGSAAARAARSSSEQAAAQGAAILARGGEPGAASPSARRVPWSSDDPVASPAGPSSPAEPDVTRVAAAEGPAGEHGAVHPQDPQAEVPTVTRGPRQQPPTPPAPESDPQAAVPTIDRATGSPKDRATPVLSDPPPYPSLGKRSGKPPREATTEARMPGPVPSWPGEKAPQRQNASSAWDSEPGSPRGDAGRAQDPLGPRASEPAAGGQRGNVSSGGRGESEVAGAPAAWPHSGASAGASDSDAARAQATTRMDNATPGAGSSGGEAVDAGGRRLGDQGAAPAMPGADAPHSFGWRPKISEPGAGAGGPGGRAGRPDPESQPPTAEFDAEAAAFEDVASGQQAAAGGGRPAAAQAVAPGALTTSDGSVYPLDRPYVVGRDPMIDDAVRRAQAAPIVIPRNRHVSRVHAYVYVEGGVVFVRDAATPGGTFVAAPGAADWIRVGQRPIELKPGWSVRIGQRILTYRADPGRRYLDG
ncbi:FHA domain-containing protein [Nocardia sp. NPDC127526]|uniref:FHA domain-containing protein n=1 Tax=Nocardia sp. NPDC127526 TaxID=3345393 RepID=UPI0036394FDF